MKKYKIFISGIQKELKEERRAVKDFILADPLNDLERKAILLRFGKTGRGTYYALRGSKGAFVTKGQRRYRSAK